MKLYVLKKREHRKYESDRLLKRVLSAEGKEGFEIKREDKGKPYFISGNALALPYISVSHTSNYWVCALSQSGALGIDIEARNRKVRSKTVKALHPLEQQYLSLFPKESREWTDEFLNIWTRKESYIKCLGSGLSEGLSSFSVVNAESEYTLFVEDKNENTFFIKNVFIKANLVASVCSKEDFAEPVLFDFNDEGEPLKPALEHAADFLAVKDYSQEGLIKKLKEKGHSGPDAAKAVNEFTERGYINDIDFATALVQRAMEKGKGRQRTEKELIEKGVCKSMAREIVLQMISLDGQSETDRAFLQAKKMIGMPLFGENQDEIPALNEKQIAKVARRLSNLGYESPVIYEIINRLCP